MALWQVDMGKRVPLTTNPSGFYYWTSVYYLESTDFPNDAQARQAPTNLEKLLTTVDVDIIWQRVHNPPGRGNIVFDHSVGFTTGQLPNPSGEYSLIMAARWRLWSDSGRWTRRLNRMPLRGGDWDGTKLSTVGLARQTASLNTFLAQGWCRNSYGELLTSGQVVPDLVMWQMRHGTKRRERNPLA